MTNDLGEFLLARIDEDEAAIALLGEEAGGDWSLLSRDRALREVRAKRRLVREGWLDETGLPLGARPWSSCGDECEDNVVEWVMRVCALPYADHPDYREEWRA